MLLHLLKWQYQPEKRSNSWESSLLEHRYRLREDIQDSLSLKPYLEAILAESYRQATKQAKVEIGLPLETFPAECLYAVTSILDDDFLPD